MRGHLAIVLSLLASAALVGVGLMSFHQQAATTRPVVFPWDIFWCNSDDDCLVVDKIGCCDCRQGGGQAAVTRTHADQLRRFLRHACRGKQTCVQVDVCRKDLEPRCVARQCTLVARLNVTPENSGSRPPDHVAAEAER